GIVQFLLQPTTFEDLLIAKQYLRSSFAHFGIEKEEHWEHLEQYCIVEHDGNYVLRFDPKIGVALQDEVERIGYVMNIWDVWEKLKCAILVLRGECSNILT
ncbi:MAG: alpha/beta hydrolase, partial [Anaplasma sp.]|nr:alpha/beta hydrolase [Anaplasma sp.]